MKRAVSVQAPPVVRQIHTEFGTFDVAERDCIGFPEGLPGFEGCRRFVVVSSAAIAPLHWLQSVEGPAASFLAIDPRLVLEGYRCVLSEADRLKLGTGPDTTLLWLALVAIDPGQGPSVNLRAPVVINPERMTGFQVLPHQSLYPLRHPLPVE
jgi:flagellar assembly factor FliW